MASNIRAKSIEGYVTDSAGNILRNSQIIIKQSTPSGSFNIEAINSDDSGYFSSKPIPSGTYEIYESGILVSRIIHTANPNSIQCFKSSQDNYNIEDIENFDVLADAKTLNSFEYFIQIESPSVNVERYGSSFPIYNYDISVNPTAGDSNDNFWDLAQFFGLDSNSRITTTRFDIEYYAPLTALSTTYQRVRWSGVPAIRFRPDTKLVIPLDYYSIVLNHPRNIYPTSSDITPSLTTIEIASSASGYALSKVQSDIIDVIKKGDIIKIKNVKDAAPNNIEFFYGIITDYGETTIELEQLRSSRFVSTTETITTGYSITRVYLYDGMFRGITSINEEVNEKFTVVENVYTQDNAIELYNYSDIA